MEVEGFGVGGFEVTHFGVPGSSFFGGIAPGDGVVFGWGFLVGAFVGGDEDVDFGAGVGFPVVPFVGAGPFQGEALHGWVLGVFDGELDGLPSGRVALEVGADEIGVPGPVVFGVARAMDSDPTTASLDELLHGSLLVWIEDIAGGHGEDDAPVLLEVVFGEDAGIFGGVNFELVRLAKGSDCFDTGGDGIVTEAGRLGKDKELGNCGGGQQRGEEHGSTLLHQMFPGDVSQ